MIKTRIEFADHFNKLTPGMGDTSSLWAYENYIGEKCKWFVCIQPMSDKTGYWTWCDKHCCGRIICYSSDLDNKEEWWGFTNYEDITFWMLRWA